MPREDEPGTTAATSGKSDPTADSRDADAERVTGYSRGDAGVFAEVDRWLRVELVPRYPRLRGEHEDLIQTVHGKLLANLRAGRFEGRSSLRSYVTGIAHRTAIDRLRELYRDRALSESMSGNPAPPEANPYRQLESRDEQRMLYQVLLSLPESCRVLWRMVFVERLDYEAIARRLSIPVGTVKSRMFHCRQKAMTTLQRIRRIGSSVRTQRAPRPTIRLSSRSED